MTAGEYRSRAQTAGLRRSATTAGPVHTSSPPAGDLGRRVEIPKRAGGLSGSGHRPALPDHAQSATWCICSDNAPGRHKSASFDAFLTVTLIAADASYWHLLVQTFIGKSRGSTLGACGAWRLRPWQGSSLSRFSLLFSFWSKTGGVK